jgi:hypothetical protein
VTPITTTARPTATPVPAPAATRPAATPAQRTPVTARPTAPSQADSSTFSFPLIIALAALALLILGLLIYFAAKNLFSSPKRAMVQAIQNQDGISLMPILIVDDQNTAIGKRNIHSVKAGYAYTVGGGNSDFLIFLVPVPPRIADLLYDGVNCTFVPRLPKYFPDIGSEPVRNCIGKTIKVISDKNYQLRIRFEKYEDPLKALNKMLNSISVPGEVK